MKLDEVIGSDWPRNFDCKEDHCIELTKLDSTIDDALLADAYDEGWGITFYKHHVNAIVSEVIVRRIAGEVAPSYDVDEQIPVLLTKLWFAPKQNKIYGTARTRTPTKIYYRSFMIDKSLKCQLTRSLEQHADSIDLLPLFRSANRGGIRFSILAREAHWEAL